MTHINVYEIDAEEIEKAANANDVSEAYIIELLCEYLPQMLEDNGMNALND